MKQDKKSECSWLLEPRGRERGGDSPGQMGKGKVKALTSPEETQVYFSLQIYSSSSREIKVGGTLRGQLKPEIWRAAAYWIASSHFSWASFLSQLRITFLRMALHIHLLNPPTPTISQENAPTVDLQASLMGTIP